MTSRSVLAQLDQTSRIAMFVAGLGAQVSLLYANRSAAYLAAPILFAITSTIIWWRGRWHAASPKAVRAINLATCAILLALCARDVVVPALDSGRPPSTLTLIGSALLTAHLAQATLARSPHDLAAAAPLVCAMSLIGGLSAHTDAVAIPVVVAMVGLVAGLASVHHAEMLRGASANRAATSKVPTIVSPRSPLVLTVAQVAAIAALGFIALPGLDKQPSRVSAIETNASVARSDALADPAKPLLDLRARGPLSNTPVFVTDASAPAYWRGVVYDHYDGASWTVTETSAANTSTVEAPLGESRADSVQVVSTSPNYVFAPGQVTAYLGAGTAVKDSDGNFTISAVSDGESASARDYRVTSVAPNVPPARLVSATGADPDDRRWLQLPANLPTRVSALAKQVTGTAPTRFAAVEAVDEYLQKHYTYTLDVPVPKAGNDPVDDFLFVSRAGFCEQFASAAVVMLRSVDIPARLVTGYAFGDTVTSPGKIVMRSSDAHAWIQVWYPGVGWVDSDPTPPAGQPAGLAPVATRHADASAPGWRAPAMVSSALSIVGRTAANPIPWFPILGGVLLCGGLIASMFVVSRRCRRRHACARSAPSTNDIGGPALGAYLRAVTSAGGAPPSPTETVREAASRLDTGLAARIGSAIDTVERECYGNAPPSTTATKTAIRIFNAIPKNSSVR